MIHLYRFLAGSVVFVGFIYFARAVGPLVVAGLLALPAFYFLGWTLLGAVGVKDK